MVKTRAIQVRTTIAQYERIKLNAEQAGFASMSAYLRHIALDGNLLLEKKIMAIHDHLLGQSKSEENRHQRPLTNYLQ